MNAVWLVLDSLSATSTPFTEDGRNTMPSLSKLASEHGIVFSRAYAPGPASPSSHGAFFTGKRPAETGMTEAAPSFNNPDIETIAGVLDSTHESLLISSNPFVFNGLQRDFDQVDDLRNEQYLLFEGASDPGRIQQEIEEESKLRRYISFLTNDGKPIRSALNGISYKLWLRRQGAGIPKQVGDDAANYQYARTMNNRITEFLDAHEQSFVCANYMDVHPPFDASEEAIAAVAPDSSAEELPIGVRGRDVYDEIQAGNEEIGRRMRTLYEAAIWDLDRKITPFIESLIERDTFVIVTADHGIWFDRDRELDEERIHVPLLVFAPGQAPETKPHSVSLRSLPRTTVDAIGGDGLTFDGPSLLDVEEDQITETEFIYDDSWGHGLVNPDGSDRAVKRDIAAVKNGARVDLLDGEIRTIRGPSAEVQELRSFLEGRRDEALEAHGGDQIEYDEVTAERLQDLGYLE